jgi:transposase
MSIDTAEELTPYARFFLEPSSPTHRQYEALRAYFVERCSSKEAAQRFGYTPGSFRVLCHQFRQDPDRQFFASPQRGPQQAPEMDRRRQRVIDLRKQNLSIYDISEVLRREDELTLSPAAIDQILREEGFARLPRRRDDERPDAVRPTAANIADVRQLDLTPRQFRTRFGGLFLLLPYLTRIPLENILQQAQWPGSQMVPAAHAVRSLLALKLSDSARHSHVMSHVFDQGLALFAGLNVIPKRAFLTEYSSRINPTSYPQLMSLWFDAINSLGLKRGSSFDLDFHTIPSHGEDDLLQKHYVSKRSRRQKGILAFLARDADEDLFCYANAELRKEDQADEILRFVDFWEQRTGHLPQELVFDSKLTVYANLHQLNLRGISFITLRRRSQNMLDEARQQPLSAWRKVELKNIARAYRHPRVIDQKIQLKGYEQPIRQLIVADLGHEAPTFLLTNQMRPHPATLIQRYAYRMIIENGIADGVDFFHMDALSSVVPMKVNADLQLTLMAHSLYRLFGHQIGNGYAEAKARHVYRNFIDAVGHVSLTEDEITVRFQKRAHNPLLLAAGFDELEPRVSWLGGKRLRLIFG